VQSKCEKKIFQSGLGNMLLFGRLQSIDTHTSVQYHKRGCDHFVIPYVEIKYVQKLLNERPRKTLGFVLAP
jgi:hypothetical protein